MERRLSMAAFHIYAFCINNTRPTPPPPPPLSPTEQEEIQACTERRLEVAAAAEGLEQLLASNLRKQRQDWEDALAGSGLEGDRGALEERRSALEAVGGAGLAVLIL